MNRCRDARPTLLAAALLAAAGGTEGRLLAATAEKEAASPKMTVAVIEPAASVAAGEYVVSDGQLDENPEPPAVSRRPLPPPAPTMTDAVGSARPDDDGGDHSATQAFWAGIGFDSLTESFLQLGFRQPLVISDEPLPGPAEAGLADEWVEVPAAGEPVVTAGSLQTAARCPTWTFQSDALFLWQNNIASRPLYLSNATGLTALNVNDGPPVVSVGPRFGLFYHLDACHAIEGNYFNVQSFQGKADVPRQAFVPGTGGTGYTALDLAGLNYDDINVASFTTSGEIQSAELNWRRRWGAATWLVGFRWVEWNQTLAIRDEATLTNLVDTVDTRTGNDLYGGQLGCDLLLWNRGETIRVNGLGKAGVFYNQAYQRTDVFSDGSPPLTVAVGNEADQTAFFGEVGANASVQLTRWLAWRVGYSVFWLSGVATPAEQLAEVDALVVPPANGINTEGSVLLHGVTTGVEARW